ncbi:hypothetical protein D3C86_1890210 [compost metagenome]
MTTTKGTAWTTWPRMMATVPVGRSMVVMKMRSEIAEIIPGTTAGRQATAKATYWAAPRSEPISMAIQTPITVAMAVVAAAMVIV